MMRNAPETMRSAGWVRNTPATGGDADPARNTPAAANSDDPARNIPTKKGCGSQARQLWRSALCILCLLLCAALLAACAPGAADASSASGALDAPGISGAADPSTSAAGISGAGAPLPEGAGSGAPASGASGAGTSALDAPGADGISVQNADFPDVDLAGNTAGSMGDGEDICGLPLAPDSGAEFPEPDRAATLEDGTVALHLDAREFVLGADDVVGYTIENTTGHSVGVSFAPRLERWTNGVWEWIPSDIGFCGTPDPVGETHTDSLRLEWFSGLTEGVYRLTYTLGYTMAEASDGQIVISEEHPFSACFYLKDA